MDFVSLPSRMSSNRMPGEARACADREARDRTGRSTKQAYQATRNRANHRAPGRLGVFFEHRQLAGCVFLYHGTALNLETVAIFLEVLEIPRGSFCNVQVLEGRDDQFLRHFPAPVANVPVCKT